MVLRHATGFDVFFGLAALAICTASGLLVYVSIREKTYRNKPQKVSPWISVLAHVLPSG